MPVSIKKLNKLGGEDKLVAVIQAVGKKKRRQASADELVDISPDGQRYVAIWYFFHFDMENGGFNQFFWNTRCKLNAEVLAFLECIGASRTREIVRQAVDKYAAALPQIEVLWRTDSVEGFASSYEICPLREVTDVFRQCEEDVEALLIKHITECPNLYVDSSFWSRFFSNGS